MFQWDPFRGIICCLEQLLIIFDVVRAEHRPCGATRCATFHMVSKNHKMVDSAYDLTS